MIAYTTNVETINIISYKRYKIRQCNKNKEYISSIQISHRLYEPRYNRPGIKL